MSAYNVGQYALDDIESQGRAWAKLIPLIADQVQAARAFFNDTDEVILAGCGSALNASISGATILQMRTGLLARAHPAADVYLFPKAVLRPARHTLAVLLSRSGQTTEVLLALEFLRSLGVRTMGVTCQANSPLARECDLPLVLEPVAERSVVTTRSFTGMVLTLQIIAATLSSDRAHLTELRRLPQTFLARIDQFHDLGRLVGQNTDLERFAFVANAPHFGLARECQLKIKEMTLLPVDAYPMLDFRHGPQSNVNERMLVTALMSDAAFPHEVRFLQDMKAIGAHVMALCERANAALSGCADFLIELGSEMSELGRAPLYIPAVQYLAYYRSLAEGFNPDQPPNLSYWVDTSNKTAEMS